MKEEITEGRGFIKKYKNLFFVLGVFLIFILIIGVFFFSFSSTEIKQVQKCGDGSFENSCSLNKPYFCSDGILSRNASRCGCPISFFFSKGKCLVERSFFSNKSIFDGNISTISRVFKYHFGNENGKIDYEIHPEILKYLSSLPRARFYSEGETPRRSDFKLSQINNPIQKEYLNPLVVAIQNLAPNSTDLQALIAIHLVQNIKYKESKFIKVPKSNFRIRLSRYPYQVLAEDEGSCEGKSELLAAMLKDMGFGVVLFYYQPENHEALGIKCPIEESYKKTGYCFVETTMPSPVSYSEGIYLGINGEGKLKSSPEIIMVSKGFSLGKNLEEYKDAKKLNKLVDTIDKSGKLNFFDKIKMDNLRKKYNLPY